MRSLWARTGYLWRLNTYGRYDEKNGGGGRFAKSVSARYIRWLVKPHLRKIPTEYLGNLLGATRAALKNDVAVSGLRRAASQIGVP